MHSPKDKLVRFTAFGFGAGYLPVAPGTFGTLVGIPLYLLLVQAGPLVYAAVVLGMFVGGHAGFVDQFVGY